MTKWSGLGATLLALAVTLGAFGAHGLRDRLDAYALGVYERAVFYHFVHAFALLLVPLFARIDAISAQTGTLACALFLTGILLFSGSLYVLAVSGIRALGAVTPFGGLAFIAAWVVLAIGLFRQPVLSS